MPNLTYSQLVDLAEGLVPADEAEALRRQVAADPSASAELAALEELIGLMRSDDSVDAPEHVIARAARLLRRPAAPPAPGHLQRIVAALRGARGPQALAAGLRSGDPAARSLTYSAEAWELDLQLTPRAGRWQLRGQLFGPELVGSVALGGSEGPVTAPINELGEFSLAPVAAGTYSLTIRLDAREILVEALELGL